MENALLPSAVKRIGKLKWLLAAVAIYACLQVISFLMFSREMAQMSALYCPVACLNRAIENWRWETRNQSQRPPDLRELNMKPHLSVMGEKMEVPEQMADSSRAVLPARVLSFPKGSKLSITNRGLEVQRPGEAAAVWSRQERAGWIPFLWMVTRY